MAGVALFPWRRALPFDQSPTVPGVPLFDATLPGLGPGGKNNYGNYISVLSPKANPMFPGADYYEIVAKQYTQQVHPSIPATTFWGYADAKTLDSRYLGGAIVAKRGRPVKLKVTNLLPPANILPTDPTIVDPAMAAAFGGRTDRIAVHLHGGLVFWDSDGGPFHWFSNADNPPGFVHGPSFINNAGPGAALFSYPNDQSARTLWYHDHAYGLTRTNAYAGLASAYLISDDAETQLIDTGVLPDIPNYPLGIPLVIQDKLFWDGGGNDPGYASAVAAGASAGSLWYPHIYEGPPLSAMTLPPLCASGMGRWDNPGIATPPVSTPNPSIAALGAKRSSVQSEK